MPAAGAIAHRLVVPLMLPVGLLALWERGAVTGTLDPVYFPPPSRIWEALRRLASDGDLGEAGATTVGRALAGWALAAALGVVIGVLLGRSARGRAAFSPTFEFLRALPAAAMVPVAILALGATRTMEVAVVAFAGLWPVLLNATAGTVSTDPLLLDAARACGLGRWRQATRIQLPAAGPTIAAGLRTSLSICLIVAVIAEMVASTSGLGNLIIESRSRYRNADVYAIVAVLGGIGLLTSAALQVAERRLLRWQRPVGSAAS